MWGLGNWFVLQAGIYGGLEEEEHVRNMYLQHIDV
jgi:hypothetical protein